MLILLRVLVLLVITGFVSTGTTLAQSVAAPPMTTATKAPGSGGGKCGQTPKGCHKNTATPKPADKSGNGKCGQTPKGCHKNQATPKPPDKSGNGKCGQTPQGCHKNQATPKPPLHRSGVA